MSENPPSPPSIPGAFAPLKRPVFAVLWVATVLGNTGSFMRDVASAWIVTDLSASPAAVATIQAAAMLPVFLLAMPAGVLSDILDRRRFLIAIQIGLAAVSAALMLLSLTGLMTVSSLIALTFLGGVGAALMAPTWQSIVPELVPRSDLKSAVALNSLGINISRSIGPALGGVLLAAFGAAVTYGADVASYVFVIAALVWWRSARHPAGRTGRALPWRLPCRAALCAVEQRDACRPPALGLLLRLCQRGLGAAAAGCARPLEGGCGLLRPVARVGGCRRNRRGAADAAAARPPLGGRADPRCLARHRRRDGWPSRWPRRAGWRCRSCSPWARRGSPR